MGGSCSDCSACDRSQTIVVEEGGWTKAVNDQNKGACEFLYLEDPTAMDKPVNRNGQRAIHIAAIKNNLDFMEWIVTQPGINLNMADRDGNTALHLASQSGFQDIIEILLRYGSDLNISNKKGLKPIDVAHKDAKTHLNAKNAKRLMTEKQKDDKKKKMMIKY